jgi:uncharacterized protein YbjQ (UPF0145 family)
MSDDETKPVAEGVAPCQPNVSAVPAIVVPVGKGEVAAMMAEEVKYSNDPEVKAKAIKLLAAGYTVRATAKVLGLKGSTVWSWRQDEAVSAAVEAGKQQRAKVLSQDLEEAANEAIRALVEVARDYDAKGAERVKAAEVILDRCGIAPRTERSNAVAPVAVAVDIDFDDRLARIVAAGSSRGMLGSESDND